MKATRPTNTARAARPLPAKPPGTKDELRHLLRLLYGTEPKKLADPLFPTIRRIAVQALARERLCRASKGAAPGLDALEKAQVAVSALIQSMNAIPAPLDSIVAHRLRNEGFQADALARIADVLDATTTWARATITRSPDGKLAMGPGDLVTRIDGDGADQIIAEAAALFSTFHGGAAISADAASTSSEFTECFWRLATGEDAIPNQTRRIGKVKANMAREKAAPA